MVAVWSCGDALLQQNLEGLAEGKWILQRTATFEQIYFPVWPWYINTRKVSKPFLPEHFYKEEFGKLRCNDVQRWFRPYTDWLWGASNYWLLIIDLKLFFVFQFNIKPYSWCCIVFFKLLSANQIGRPLQDSLLFRDMKCRAVAE